jgi:beta-phosphoglucomutase-like phosphatase (HAD superfamily)
VTLGRTGLLERFEGRIFSATDPGVERGKPFPDLFLHAAKRMGKTPAAAAVVEDSVPGTQAAVAAGMRALGYIGSPIARTDAMRAAGGTLFRRMAELPGLLGL